MSIVVLGEEERRRHDHGDDEYSSSVAINPTSKDPYTVYTKEYSVLVRA